MSAAFKYLNFRGAGRGIYRRERTALKRTIRNSAKALIIKDGKMLALKIRDQDEEWFILPGGG